MHDLYRNYYDNPTRWKIYCFVQRLTTLKAWSDREIEARACTQLKVSSSCVPRKTFFTFEPIQLCKSLI